MKKILSLFLALSLTLSLLGSVSVFAAETTGSITGSSVTYKFNDETGVYTLTGTGGLPHKRPINVGVTQTILNSATKVVVGEGITELGYESLYDFKNVKEISFPSTLTKIQAGVFINNSALSGTFTFPKTVTYLGGYTLMNDWKITTVAFEGGRESELKLIKETFKGMSGLNSIHIPDNVSIDTTKVTSVADLFGGSTTVSEVVIFTANQSFIDTLKGFDDFATSGLTICDIPSGVESYGGISGLPGGYWTYGNGTLNIYGRGAYTKNHYNCDYAWKGIVDAKNITKVVFNEGITEIPLYFCGCDSIEDKPLDQVTEVTIPKTLKAIGRSAFFKATKLETINGGFPEGLETIGDQCFQGCPLKPTQNNALLLPSTLKSVGANTFCNNSSANGYTVVSFGENSQLTSIGKYAFLDVKSLKTIVVPSGVTEIGMSAFQRSTSDLLELYFEGKPSVDESAFKGRTNVKIYALADGVGTVGNVASTRVYRAGDVISYTGQKTVDISLAMPYDGVKGVLNTGASFNVSARKTDATNKLPGNFSDGVEVSGITATVTSDYVVKLRGIPELADGEKLVVTMTDAKDKQGNTIENNSVILYKDGADVGLISGGFYDANNEEVDVNSSKIEAGTRKIEFKSADATDQNLMLTQADGTVLASATFSNGTYTIELSSALEPETEYVISRNDTEYLRFTTDKGKIGVGDVKIDGTTASFNYYNSTASAKTIYIMMTKGGTLCDSVEIPAGGKGSYTKTIQDGAEVFVTDDLDALNILSTSRAADTITPVDAASARVSISSFDSSRTATLSGNLGSGKHRIGTAVYKNTENRAASDVIWVGLTDTDEDGSFSMPMTFSETTETKLYSAVMGDMGGMIYENERLPYAKKSETETALGLLNNAIKSGSATEVRSVISSNAIALEFIYDVYDNAYSTDSDKKEAYELKTASFIISEAADYRENASVGFTYAKKSKAVELFRMASIVAAFQEGLIDDIDKVGGDIPYLSVEPVKTWYNTKTGVSEEKTKSWRAGMTDRLSNVQFTDFDDFSDKLTASLVFSIVKNPVGTTSLKEALTAFGSAIKSDTVEFNPATEITDKACVSLADAKKNYSGFDYTALINDIKAYNKKNVYDGGSGTGGNGTGGGGYGGGTGSVTVDPDYIDNKIPEIKNGFTDIDDFEWAKEAISALYEKGIINGKANGIFAPDDNVLREEFAKMVVTVISPESANREMNFEDVSEGDWYYDYIKDAYGCGIINGVSETSFGAGISITRQDICVMIANALKMKGVSAEIGDKAQFEDFDEVADYAAEAVAMLTELGVLNGYEDNTFRPNNYATRAEATKMIYALLELV